MLTLFGLLRDLGELILEVRRHFGAPLRAFFRPAAIRCAARRRARAGPEAMVALVRQDLRGAVPVDGRVVLDPRRYRLLSLDMIRSVAADEGFRWAGDASTWTDPGASFVRGAG